MGATETRAFTGLKSCYIEVFATISKENQHLEVGMLDVKLRPAPLSVKMSLELLGWLPGKAAGPIPITCSSPADIRGSSRHLTPLRTKLRDPLPEGNYPENRSYAVKCGIEAKRAEQRALQNVSSLVQYPQAVSLFTLGSLFPLSYLL